MQVKIQTTGVHDLSQGQKRLPRVLLEISIIFLIIITVAYIFNDQRYRLNI